MTMPIVTRTTTTQPDTPPFQGAFPEADVADLDRRCDVPAKPSAPGCDPVHIPLRRAGQRRAASS